MNHSHTSLSDLISTIARWVQRRKRPGGRRDTAGLPSKSSERERQLENIISDLKRQLRDERVRFIVDLRVAVGLMSENERTAAISAASKLSDEDLEFVRGSLVEMLAHFNTTATPSSPLIMRSVHYIA